MVKETTKTHKVRTIGINDCLMGLLKKLKAEDPEGGLLLNRVKLGCVHSSHVAREFANDCSKAGVRIIKFHDLRHTYATQFVAKGGDIRGLAGVLGHTTTSMTERYAHFTPEHARRVASIVSFDVPESASVVSISTRCRKIK